MSAEAGTNKYFSDIASSYEIFSYKLGEDDRYKMVKYTSEDFIENNSRTMEAYPEARLYTYQYDEIINTVLRKDYNFTPKAANIAFNIIAAVAYSVPINKELVLFRGVSKTDTFQPYDVEIGSTFTEKGFGSKSCSVSKAINFTEDSCCLYMIYYPPGSKHIYMSSEDGQSIFQEYELVSYPGEIFKVEAKFTANIGAPLNIIVVRYDGNVYPDTGVIASLIQNRISHETEKLIQFNINKFKELTLQPEVFALSKLDADNFNIKITGHSIRSDEPLYDDTLEKFFFVNRDFYLLYYPNINNYIKYLQNLYQTYGNDPNMIYRISVNGEEIVSGRLDDSTIGNIKEAIYNGDDIFVNYSQYAPPKITNLDKTRFGFIQVI